MTTDEFREVIKKNNPDYKKYGIIAPPTTAQAGLDILIHHFLGKDWYCVTSIHTEQVNTEAIYEILEKYPGKIKFKDRVKWFFRKLKIFFKNI